MQIDQSTCVPFKKNQLEIQKNILAELFGIETYHLKVI